MGTIVLLSVDRTQVGKRTGQCPQVEGDGAGRLPTNPRHTSRKFAEHTGIDRIRLAALTERFRVQFRSEIFNIFNHPNFNAPGFGGNGVVSIPGSLNFKNPNFGRIGSTRDAPYDPRQIQFALKLYY